jgi:ribosome-associated protein
LRSFRGPAMMTTPERLARRAGCDGSSAPQARREIGRNGVHRRLSSFACHPTQLQPPGCAQSIHTGTGASYRSNYGQPINRGVPLADPANAPAAPTQPVDVEALHSLVMQSLDDDQAVEMITIPLAGKSSIADHMVIASGRSSRQVASMANKLADKIKQQFGKIVRIEGLPVADWVLIDAEDVIVHLFRPEVRTFYNLERMWAFGDESASKAASAPSS